MGRLGQLSQERRSGPGPGGSRDWDFLGTLSSTGHTQELNKSLWNYLLDHKTNWKKKNFMEFSKEVGKGVESGVGLNPGCAIS